jgi:hypothetical protein
MIHFMNISEYRDWRSESQAPENSRPGFDRENTQGMMFNECIPAFRSTVVTFYFCPRSVESTLW